MLGEEAYKGDDYMINFKNFEVEMYSNNMYLYIGDL